MTESDSMNQTTQKYLEDALDSGKDITDTKVRTEINLKIKEKFPDWNTQSIASSLSKSKMRIAKKRGIKPSNLGVGSKKKLFDDVLDLEVDNTGKVEGEGLESKNPLVAKKGKDGKPIIKKERESKLSESVYASVGNLAYDAFALTDDDMEDLTEGEKKDIGNVMKALGDQYAGEKAELVLGIGAIFGLFINKKRKAKSKRKARELKEGKPIQKEKTTKEKIFGTKPEEKLSGTTTTEEEEPKIASEGGRQN